MSLQAISIALRPLLALALCLAAVSQACALETELFGRLAVALEPDVAKELGLSDEQQQALWRLADRREQEGMTQVMRLADATADERMQELAPFRTETERDALKLLTPAQRQRLHTIASERDDPALRETESQASPREKNVEITVGDENEPRGTASVVSGETETSGTRTGEPESGATTADTTVAPQAADPQPADLGVTHPADGKLSFNFRNQPWADVLDWFADRAGLSLVVDTPPPGALNYRDDRRYTPAEALDVLNGVLLTKGYTLVRKDRMLLVINLEDTVPPNVVTDVPLAQLDQRGEYELVRVLFRIDDADPEGVAEELRRLAGPQGSVVVLPVARMLQVTETAGRIRVMRSVVEAAEHAAGPDDEEVEVEELRVYATEGADPDSTLKVMQTLLADTPLAVDELTGNLIALATPSEHDAIRAALDKLQADGRRVELIHCKVISPASAAIVVERLFNPNADKENPNPNAPVVEADRLSGALLVRGTSDQVRQVRDLVERLDAAEPLEDELAGGTLRTIPLSSAHAQATLNQLRQVWPTLRGNPLRIVAPPEPIPVFRPGAELEVEVNQTEEERLLEQLFRFESESASEDRSTDTRTRSPFRFANETELVEEEQAAGEQAPSNEQAQGRSPVLIVPGPGSTVIASDDPEALDLVEDIFAAFHGDVPSSDRQYAVFYLKYADALTATAMLQAIYGGESGDGGLMGDLAGAAIGGSGGDLVGDLLGMGSGSSLSGFSALGVDLVPDVRLNALIVSATPRDLETINQLLRVIDSPRGPDRIEVAGRTRLIHVENAQVEEVAEVVRQVFSDRIASGGSGQPTPQDMMRMLSGRGRSADDQEPEKMTIGIDERSNSLVIRSSEPLYEEVLALVEQLDSVEVDSKATRIVSVQGTNSEALKQTLASLLGENARLAGTNTPQTNAQNDNNQGRRGGRNDDNDARRQQRDTMRALDQMRRFQDMMRRAQQQQGGGGRGGGGRGGGGGGRGGN